MAICILYNTSNINLLIFYLIIVHQIKQAAAFQTNYHCNERCGSLKLPFPFYLNFSSSSSCGGTIVEVANSDVFRLSCDLQQQSSEEEEEEEVLHLNMGSQRYRVIQFFTDGVLIDYLPNSMATNFSSESSSCNNIPYIVDLEGFAFEGNSYFGISADNVVGLYECNDTSFCKLKPHSTSCEEGPKETTCLYPLSDRDGDKRGKIQLARSVYQKGFSVFSKFGCRGFSCWVDVDVPYSSNTNKTTTATAVTSTQKQHGIKLEWAIPRNNSSKTTTLCASNAYTINATSVPSGVRCQCPFGFSGDAFSHGLGCFKSTCLKDGMEAYGKDCNPKKHFPTKRVKVLIGVVVSALGLVSLTAVWCGLCKRASNKKPSKVLIPDKCTNISTGEVNKKPHLFSYDELEQATKGFDDSRKLGEGTNGALYAGILGDGSHVAVHKLPKFEQHYFNEEKGAMFLESIEALSGVTHRNMARVVGCCLDMTSPMVVYEYPNYGTLEHHLLLHSNNNGNSGVGLEWRDRLKIASETADFLAFLRHEIYPPIIHQHLHPAFIFPDYNSCVKVAGFLPSTDPTTTDVYSIGLLLVDLIGGVCFPSTIALGKITHGKIEEIADPVIQYDEHKDEIDIVADLATRCLLFGGKLGMINVAKELMHLIKQQTNGNSNYCNATTFGIGGCTSKRGTPPTSLEETFSNSSLLQMISMSPDSIYAPHFSV